MTSAVTIAQMGNVNQSFRNKIYNGAMMIDQRNAGASVTPTTTNTYTLDRWQAQLGVASKYSVQQNAGSVTPPAGYTNYLGVTSLSAYSVGSTDYFAIRQIIEGFNIADLAWGTVNAKPITLSFWVYSSLTGTFGGYLNNASDGYAYPFSYTISSASTWTQISLNIAGPTSGTWTTTNGQGIKVGFSLGMGSTLCAPAGAWIAGNYLSATSTVSVVGTNGATFYITGVQLEAGTNATPFEFRPYGTEFQLCQRYLYRLNNTDGAYSYNSWCFRDASYFLVNIRPPVAMRATPTLTDPVYSMAGLSTGTGTGQVNIYNLNAAGLVTVTAGTGAWDITNSTNEKVSVRFTGTSLSGSSSNIGGVDAFITGSKFFLSAEL